MRMHLLLCVSSGASNLGGGRGSAEDAGGDTRCEVGSRVQHYRLSKGGGGGGQGRISP